MNVWHLQCRCLVCDVFQATGTIFNFENRVNNWNSSNRWYLAVSLLMQHCDAEWRSYSLFQLAGLKISCGLVKGKFALSEYPEQIKQNCWCKKIQGNKTRDNTRVGAKRSQMKRFLDDGVSDWPSPLFWSISSSFLMLSSLALSVCFWVSILISSSWSTPISALCSLFRIEDWPIGGGFLVFLFIARRILN